MTKILGRRLAALESGNDGEVRCHAIAQFDDDTEAKAVAVYEARHGPIADGANVLRVFIRKPGHREVLA
jgi:hypothetical protein